MSRGKKRSGGKAPATKTIKTTPREFQATISEMISAKTRARNASGSKSSTLTDFATKSGMSKRAIGLVAQLAELDDIKRHDTLEQILMGFELMGWGKQSDLFETVGRRIQEAIAAAEAEKKGATQGSPGLPLDEARRGFEQAKAAADAKPKRQRSGPANEDVPADDEAKGGGRRSPGSTLDGLTASAG